MKKRWIAAASLVALCTPVGILVPVVTASLVTKKLMEEKKK